MTTLLSPVLENDADQLEGTWGIPIALEMLQERIITPLDFVELCEETVRAIPTTSTLGATWVAAEKT
jgi:hypothetical protein